MLRITTMDIGGKVTLKLEGKLSAPGWKSLSVAGTCRRTFIRAGF